MKKCIYFISALLCMVVSAQGTEQIEVKEVVVDFFKAFHAQDSIAIKKLVHSDIILQRIGFGTEGTPVLQSNNFDDLVKSIISIADSVSFHERLTDYNIQIDGPMANVWTPYEFWLNNEFHHCGVNSFQLFKDTDGWRIIYLIDTRRKEDCNNPSE
jgi:hypothetical protein